ncbi:MAG: primosomal protein N' [Candidatus Firestonebacteria bacterium]
MTDFAAVAINAPSDISFHYKVPEELKGRLGLYQRVVIPVRKRKEIGFITGFPETSAVPGLKFIEGLYDPFPLLDGRLSELAGWLAGEYSSSLGMALHTMLPDKLKANPPKRKKYSALVKPEMKSGAVSSLVKSIQAPSKERFEYYFCAAAAVLKSGRKVMFVLPETGMLREFAKRAEEILKVKSVQLHGKLPYGKFYEALTALLSPEACVIAASRQAIFLPVNGLGLVIIEEENAQSYRSEETPKFLTRDVLVKRGELEGFDLLLGSYLLSLDTRVKFPPILDLYPGFDRLNILQFSERTRLLSPLALKPVERAIKAGMNAVIITTRKGFSTSFYCNDCNYLFKCEACGISLVRHADAGGTLRCRYCGKSVRVPDACPKCKSSFLGGAGFGAEKIEAEVKRLLPEAAVIRIDSERFQKAGEKWFMREEFASSKGAVAVGTQLAVSLLKGLKEGVVVVVGLEYIMNLNDYTSTELAASFLAGICDLTPPGVKIILQVKDLKNPVVAAIVEGDINRYIKAELKSREDLDYPPYFRLAFARVKGRTEAELKNYSEAFASAAGKLAGKSAVLLGPLPLEKQYGYFMEQFLLKSKEPLGPLLNKVMAELETAKLSIRKNLDIDIR